MTMYCYETIETAWGAFIVVFSDLGLVATYFPERSSTVQSRSSTAQSRTSKVQSPAAEDRVLNDWPNAKRKRGCAKSLASDVRHYFLGRVPSFDTPIDIASMTPFRQCVLEACRRVPYGQTASYQDLARAVGRPAATRAVGSTMAHNPIPLIIPCHRIVRSDGSLGGFSAADGVSLKRRMLRLEGATIGQGARVA